jgi:hypothetical protein
MVSACAAFVGLAAVASAQSPISIVTNEDPAGPGAFTLNFDALGITARSNITSTTYELSVDPILGTARFVSYLQHVQPLTLPGGFDTGDITVRIVEGSSTGTYDVLTRTFSTSEEYEIHFTGDLSLLGLTSPVVLPSSSLGELIVDPVEGGEVAMNWNGTGQLGDPSAPLEFTYTCAVNTLFPATPNNVIGLTLVSDIVSLPLPLALEQNLVALLARSLDQIRKGKGLQAIQSLREFIRRVDGLGGFLIDEAAADDIVASASQAIALFGPVRLPTVAPGGIRSSR